MVGIIKPMYSILRPTDFNRIVNHTLNSVSLRSVGLKCDFQLFRLYQFIAEREFGLIHLKVTSPSYLQGPEGPVHISWLFQPNLHQTLTGWPVCPVAVL